MNPARTFLESLDRRPGIRERPRPIRDMLIAPAAHPVGRGIAHSLLRINPSIEVTLLIAK